MMGKPSLAVIMLSGPDIAGVMVFAEPHDLDGARRWISTLKIPSKEQCENIRISFSEGYVEYFVKEKGRVFPVLKTTLTLREAKMQKVVLDALR